MTSLFGASKKMMEQLQMESELELKKQQEIEKERLRLRMLREAEIKLQHDELVSSVFFVEDDILFECLFLHLLKLGLYFL